jgi:DNA mismatch repair ATPase MutS
LFFSAVQLPARKTNQSPEVVALAQSSDHVLNFFKMLRMELAFYVSCLNLRDRLAAKEEPVCFPAPRSIGERTLSFRGLYDVCLSLHIKDREVGNGVDASGKSLLVVTGTNRGGKSTFLRSIGLAQLMMQSGMFVGAESFEATLCPALFTRYKQEEDATKKSGKFDEELARMSGIVNHVLPNSLVLFNESFSATNEREGSEIARQIVTALVEKRVGVFYVTHLHKFARGFFNRNSDGAMLLVPFSDRHSGFPAKSREPTDQNLVACSLCACAACAAQQH